MTWAMAMGMAARINRRGLRARVTGHRNMNGAWIYRATPIR